MKLIGKGGFSLVELITSLAIGSLLLMGLLVFSQKTTAHYVKQRGRLAVRGNLSMAHRELNRLVRGLEPEVFKKFPMRENPFHQVAHSHDAVQFGANCPGGKADCLLIWDLKPIPAEPLVYEIDSHHYR